MRFILLTVLFLGCSQAPVAEGPAVKNDFIQASVYDGMPKGFGRLPRTVSDRQGALPESVVLTWDKEVLGDGDQPDVQIRKTVGKDETLVLRVDNRSDVEIDQLWIWIKTVRGEGIFCTSSFSARDGLFSGEVRLDAQSRFNLQDFEEIESFKVPVIIARKHAP